jgi:hypothetical protein
MAEKIIFLTTASLEEDLKEGKTLDLHQVKGIFERYGESDTNVFCQENNICFDAVECKKALIFGAHPDDTWESMKCGLPLISIEGDMIVLEAAMNPGDNNKIYCTKVKCSSY